VADTLEGCDDRIISVIRNRVDAMGTNEPVIQNMKGHRLLVQIPGTNANLRAEAKASLQSAAFLEFRLTHPKNAELAAKLLAKDIAPEGYEKGGSGYVRSGSWAEVSRRPGYAARLASWEVPDARYRFMLEDMGDGSYAPNFVSRTTELTGSSLKKASVMSDPVEGNYVTFTFDREGGRKFSVLTRNYQPNGPKNPSPVGRQLAIILDDVLISAPTIQSEIGSEGRITSPTFRGMTTSAPCHQDRHPSGRRTCGTGWNSERPGYAPTSTRCRYREKAQNWALPAHWRNWVIPRPAVCPKSTTSS
jgi:preprotein translocase subunit SecD